MFASYFPTPRIFFPAAILSTAFCMVLWYAVARDLGPVLSIGNLIGLPYPAASANPADVAVQVGRDLWLYEYMIVAGAIFVGAVRLLLPHRWVWWSAGVSAVIIFLLWFQVQLDVMINSWFGGFYNLIQKALSKPNAITLHEFYSQQATFLGIAMIYIFSAVLNAFITSHFIFRWRTAMNEFYAANWHRLRQIEGASQRVQEDTMRFAETLEGLGASLVQALMTLIAFLPILWGLSSYVKELPLIGPVPQALVFVAVIWAALGTGLLALAGIRLPGLEFRNQRVGEDLVERAQPPTLQELFADIRANYFRLYLNFLYFNIARYGYLQASALIAYCALGPTIVAGGLTLGVLTQITRAFGRVESSFQYLVNSWSTIVSQISIYKRLKAFEATLDHRPLDSIEAEAVGP
jgi:peptide/bleomycin uptake transporter